MTMDFFCLCTLYDKMGMQDRKAERGKGEPRLYINISCQNISSLYLNIYIFIYLYMSVYIYPYVVIFL